MLIVRFCVLVGFEFKIHHKWCNNDGRVTVNDGSKKNGLCICGAGIYSGDLKLNVTLNLGNVATIFQAEVLAMLECCCSDEVNSFNQSEICISTDSKSSVKVLRSPCIWYTQILSENANMGLMILGARNQVTVT